MPECDKGKCRRAYHTCASFSGLAAQSLMHCMGSTRGMRDLCLDERSKKQDSKRLKVSNPLAESFKLERFCLQRGKAVSPGPTSDTRMENESKQNRFDMQISKREYKKERQENPPGITVRRPPHSHKTRTRNLSLGDFGTAHILTCILSSFFPRYCPTSQERPFFPSCDCHRLCSRSLSWPLEAAIWLWTAGLMARWCKEAWKAWGA